MKQPPTACPPRFHPGKKYRSECINSPPVLPFPQQGERFITAARSPDSCLPTTRNWHDPLQHAELIDFCLYLQPYFFRREGQPVGNGTDRLKRIPQSSFHFAPFLDVLDAASLQVFLQSFLNASERAESAESDKRVPAYFTACRHAS